MRLLWKGKARGVRVGKRKVKSEEELKNMVLPVANDVLGIAEKMLGFDRVLVKCQDGHERLCRIRGKMKRRMWIRLGDIVFGFSMEFPVRQAGRHHMAIQKKSSRMAKKERIPEDLTDARA